MAEKHRDERRRARSTSATIAKANTLEIVSKSDAREVEHLTWSRLRERTRHVEVGDENGGGGEGRGGLWCVAEGGSDVVRHRCTEKRARKG